MFNDGLARFGIEDAFDQEGVPSNWISSAPTTTNTTTGNTTELKVKFTIGGLSYQLTVVQKLAAAVLLLHILIALVHSVWLILWTGESSGCWDSVTELVVLAQNSQPAFAALGNAAAGIKHSSTFAKIVSIRSTKIPNDARADHLELVYEDDETHVEEDGMVLVQNNHADIGRLMNLSTWSTHRPHSRTSSVRSVEPDHDAEIASNMPLVDVAPGDTTHSLHPTYVQVGHAYG
ncbi:MAG: hypothetical protein L6R35_006433 [Caloplaca aegaea]|nr:MAG: hypothetical protein L6R35_006433 [Caloplaca aegaea]